MNISVFDIPLLKDKIVCYLSRSDMRCCLLVSKEWHDWFIPVYWREFKIKKALKVALDFHKVRFQFYGHNFNSEWILDIIKACSHVEQLNLRFGLTAPPAENLETFAAAEAAKGEELIPKLSFHNRKTNIKSLSIQLPYKHQERSILVPLVANSPQLEILQLYKIRTSGTLRDLTKEFKAGKCPQLKSIHIQTMAGSVTSIVAELLRSIGSFRNEDDSIGYESQLNTIMFEESLFIEETCLSVITQNHSKLLTSLVIGSNLLRIDLLMDMLGNLPALTNLAAGIWRGNKTNQDTYMDQVFQMQWACLGLRSLKLILDLKNPETTVDRFDDPDWKGSTADRLNGHVFAQIAKLKSLRQLQLDTQGVDLLVLENGYLSLLSALKELRGLSLKGIGIGKFRMGADEAIWVERLAIFGFVKNFE
ncbi:hypothetical protein BGZ76_006881 [Entomortierella beljakovae]|nr:hypothetical protein BGZ76_006881 [Entomortierella beljakovae]